MIFEEGDVVSHHLGGTLMTVEQIRTDKLVACVWMDMEARVQRDVFEPVTLQKWRRVEESRSLEQKINDHLSFYVESDLLEEFNDELRGAGLKIVER